MKTFILEQPGRFASTDTEPPGSPGPGDVLVQVLKVGICGTDLHAFEGTQPFFHYPRILGHELAVEVVGIGEGVAGLKSGDRCAVNPYMACGACVACRAGRTNCCAKLSVIGVHTDGGMRDRLLLPATHLYKCTRLPAAQIPLVETLAVGCHAVGRAGAEPGHRALVAGAGPIGLSVIEFLRLAGADIGVIEKRPERLEFARRNYGLTRCYPSHEDARQEGPSWLVFDCTGDRGSMETTLQRLEHGGRLIFVGLINDHVSLFDPDIHRREATILSSRNSTASDLRRVLECMEEGRIDVTAWPTERASPGAMNGRFPVWLRREAGIVKAIVDWT